MILGTGEGADWRTAKDNRARQNGCCMTTRINEVIRRIPGKDMLSKTGRFQRLQHWRALRNEERENSHFTGFRRLPTQYEALAGPVLELLAVEDREAPLRIVVAGCSNGAEAYTVAKYLRDAGCNNYEIIGFDIEMAVVETARSARYDAETEVHNNKKLPPEFIDELFTRDGDTYEVRAEFREGVSFEQSNVLDLEALSSLGPADIIFAQNFLFHLSPKDALEGMHNLGSILADRAVMFLDGTDLPVRSQATTELSLAPMTYKMQQIHDEARWARAPGWPHHYWGLEPFGTVADDIDRRYATIFTRDNEAHD